MVLTFIIKFIIHLRYLLKEIIESEEYDTDSVDIDLDIFIESGVSNISLALNDDTKNLIINQMIDEFNKYKSYLMVISLS